MADPPWHQLPSSYDRVADAYERTFLDELDAKPYDRELLLGFAGTADGTIADLGCGPGQVGAFLRDTGRQVIGVDLSPAMVGLAAARLDAAVVADLRALPFADRCLGAVVAFYSFIHVPRDGLAGALDEIVRVLRPGGSFLMSAHEGAGTIEQQEFLGQPVPFVATLFTLDELEGALHRSGLQVRRAEQRAPYPTEHPTARLYVEATTTPSPG
jgi:SAM-dependent methyltransferase